MKYHLVENSIRGIWALTEEGRKVTTVDKDIVKKQVLADDRLQKQFREPKHTQSIEKDFNISLFDRMQFAYKKEGRVEVASRKEFEKLLSQGVLNDDTIVFNNLVETNEELKSRWEIPLKDSWHRQLV